MRRYPPAVVVALAIVLGLPLAAAAQPITFKLLTNYSQASFRSDAPLETFVGTSALEGIQGTLSVDPARPQEAKGSVKVDMNRVTTGIDKRDADMRTKPFLETENEANRWVTFEVQRVEIAAPLVPGKEVPAKVHGLLTIKQKTLPKVADATVSYIKLTPEQIEGQKRFGFTADNLKIKAKLQTTFTDHNMQVPQLLFLKVANQIDMSTDLVFVRE